MGPRTGNAQKTGKTWQKYPFFSSTMEIARNLKISMLQLAIVVAIFSAEKRDFQILQYKIGNCTKDDVVK